MEQQKNDLNLNRLRSSGAAIADGYRLYMGNFRRILRSSWIHAIVYAVTLSFFTIIHISFIPAMSIMHYMKASNEQMFSTLGQLMLLTLTAWILFILASTIIASTAFSALSEHQSTGAITAPFTWLGKLDTYMLGRMLKAVIGLGLLVTVANVLVTAVGVGCIVYLGRMAGLVALGVLSLLFVAAIVPLGYPLTKYMLTPTARLFPTLASAYPVGLRHWGDLFVVQLITAIVCMVLVFATELPAVILTMANVSSQMGTLTGDPTGMPEYMGWLTVVVCCIAGFIQAYVHMSALFPLYYLYGSIETQENERKQTVNTQN